MGNIGALKVSSTTPINGNIEVKTTDDIVIKFNLDIDSNTLTDGVTVITKGTNMPVMGSLSYDKNRSIIFRPAIPFKPNTGYNVIVNSTIKSILGGGCQQYTFNFTTYAVEEVKPPVMISPVNQITLYDSTVEFSWNSVIGVNEYNIQLSKFENFTTIEWSININCPVETINTRLISIVPEYKLDTGVIYFWRVRAIYNALSPLDSFVTKWSSSNRFNIELQVNPIIVPEDDEIDPFGELLPIRLIESFPEIGFSNVAVNLNAIYFIIDSLIDPTKIDPRKFVVEGTYVTEDSSLNTYDPSATTKILTNINHGEVSGSWSIIPDEENNRTIVIFQPVEL